MIFLFFVLFILLVGLVLVLMLVGGVITLFIEKPKPIESVEAPTIVSSFVNR